MNHDAPHTLPPEAPHIPSAVYTGGLPRNKNAISNVVHTSPRNCRHRSFLLQLREGQPQLHTVHTSSAQATFIPPPPSHFLTKAIKLNSPQLSTQNLLIYKPRGQNHKRSSPIREPMDPTHNYIYSPIHKPRSRTHNLISSSHIQRVPTQNLNSPGHKTKGPTHKQQLPSTNQEA